MWRTGLTAERSWPIRSARRGADVPDRHLAAGRDGVLDFLGRADSQVKIRGFRIEPGRSRRRCCAMRRGQAAVIARETSRAQAAVAYVVAPAGMPLMHRRYGHLAAASRLHGAGAFVPLRRCADGERQARPARLRRPICSRWCAGTAHATGDILCGIAEVLRLERVGIGDTSSSLAVIRCWRPAISRIRATWMSSYRSSRSSTDGRGLVRRLEGRDGTAGAGAMGRPADTPLSFAQRRCGSRIGWKVQPDLYHCNGVAAGRRARHAR